MTTKLFIYGTLQDPNVQIEVIGRVCQGQYALVDNYILMRDWAVEGTAYPRLYPHSAGCVIGQIIEVTEDELKILDEYETDAYKRTNIHIKGVGLVDTYYFNEK
jgi:gamma-glutamylcyclotransferase (GGCT)/AIG2-like uncharacterized protein YtfP